MAIDWKQYLNAYTLGGAVGGGYLGHVKLAKKHGYYGIAGGAVGGAVAGAIVKKLLNGSASQQPQLTPQQAAQMQAAQRQQAAAQPSGGQDGYVDLGLGEYEDNPHVRAEYEAQKAAAEELGSLSGDGDLGSLSGAPGFDADTIDYSELFGEEASGSDDGMN